MRVYYLLLLSTSLHWWLCVRAQIPWLREGPSLPHRTQPSRPTGSLYAPADAQVNVDRGFYQCDRVKPCHACCAHGYPSRCVYENVPDEEAKPISQAEEIRNLRAEIRDLRARIDGKKDGMSCSHREWVNRLSELWMVR